MEKGSLIITYGIAIAFLAAAVYGFINNDIQCIIAGLICGPPFFIYATIDLHLERTEAALTKAGLDEEIVRMETETESERVSREMKEFMKAHNLKVFEEHRMYETERGKCPRCGKALDYDNRVICINCGTVIIRSRGKPSVTEDNGDVLAPRMPENDPMKNMMTECPHCRSSLGTIVGDFCPHCGKKLR